MILIILNNNKNARYYRQIVDKGSYRGKGRGMQTKRPDSSDFSVQFLHNLHGIRAILRDIIKVNIF